MANEKRLIDANEVMQRNEEAFRKAQANPAENLVSVIQYRTVKEMVSSSPTVDAAPVVHGRWEKHKTMHGFVYCSACRDVYLDAEWLADGKWTYCPNCGAKMDLEAEENA